MDCKNQNKKQYEYNCAGKCSRVNYCCPECGCMVTTKYIYICKTIHFIENRASVCIGDTIFWSNKTVAKKIVEYQL